MSENNLMDNASNMVPVGSEALESQHGDTSGVDSCNCSKLHPGFKLGLVLVAVSLLVVNLTAVAYPNLVAKIGDALPDTLMYSDQTQIVGHNRGSCSCHEEEAVAAVEPVEMNDEFAIPGSGETAIDDQEDQESAQPTDR